jgi:DNA processing protein
MRLPLPDDSTPEEVPGRDAAAEQRALVALSLVKGIGPGRLRALLARFRTPARVFRASRSALTGVDGIGRATAASICEFDDHDAVERQLRRAEELDATLIAPWDARFPERLKHIYDPPALLWMRGTLTAADERALAIVGTRRCTDYGRAQARHFAGALARRGFTVVSGLAYGIDAAAHKGALDAGGRTIAVLGSGLGRIYPQKNAGLAAQAAKQGAVLSELGLDAAPDAPNFPERNRIVSGLTLGTLVVESHAEGGSLITARMALEQNREVFAVPGSVGRPASMGTNRLIQRSHAKLVLDVDDILEELPVPSDPEPDATEAPEASPAAPPALSGAEERLYEVLSATPMHVDRLCSETGVAPSTALATLLSLEMKGLVRQLAGKQFRRA